MIHFGFDIRIEYRDGWFDIYLDDELITSARTWEDVRWKLDELYVADFDSDKLNADPYDYEEAV